MSSDGICWVGLRRLAEYARCAVNTVRKRLEVLEDAGLLEVQKDGQARTVYRALIPGAVDADVTVETITEAPVDIPVEAPAGVSPGERSVSPGESECVTGRHTFPNKNTVNPTQRQPSRRRWGDPAPEIPRPLPGRPPVQPVEVTDNGADGLWVVLP